MWFQLPQWSTRLDTYKRTPSLTIHSTPGPSQCLTVFNSQNQATICKAQWKIKMWSFFVKKSWRISRFQDRRASNQEWGPSEQVALCDCTDHTSMKSALPTAFSLVGFHCLNCFLSACPASGACAENWMSLFTEAHRPLGASRFWAGPPICWGGGGRVGGESQACCSGVAGKGFKPWFGKFPLGQVGSVPWILHSFWKRMQCRRSLGHCAKLWVF